ncbi:MAG: hypothetical protein J0I48_13795 [Devosia sp.]|nr:hypothetical protein [Devosia sp.]
MRILAVALAIQIYDCWCCKCRQPIAPINLIANDVRAKAHVVGKKTWHAMDKPIRKPAAHDFEANIGAFNAGKLLGRGGASSRHLVAKPKADLKFHKDVT